MNNMLISYRTLRRVIGIIAMAFPLVLILFIMLTGSWTETSISATYWSNAGILFTSMLIMFGVFLFTYQGYNKVDNVLTNIMAFGMLTVALFPCEGGDIYLVQFLSSKVTNIIHYISAGITFSMMGVVSLVLFTKGEKDMPEKQKRNKVYTTCAYIIFGMIAAMLLVELIPRVREATDNIRLFYWLEAVVVWAFGISWLIKGETFLKD